MVRCVYMISNNGIIKEGIMLDDFEGIKNLNLHIEHAPQEKETSYPQEERHIAFKVCSLNRNRSSFQIKNEIDMALKKAGIKKSAAEIDELFESASKTLYITMEVFKLVRNIK